MDPMSASVAVVGLAASLTTLAALVVDSSKTLYNVRRKLKNAPEDIKRLSRQLKQFECLLSEVQERTQDHQAEYAASGIETLIATAVKYMGKDMGDFECTVQRLKGSLSAPASPRKLLGLRIQHILQEERVQEYQRLIASHIGTLTLLLEMLTSRVLYNVSLQTTNLLAKTDAGLGAIHSDLAAFFSSQNSEQKKCQDALTTIEHRLYDLQGQLGADAVTMRKRNIGKIVVAKDFQLPSNYQRNCMDLRLLGKVISSRNFVARKGSSGPIIWHCTFTFIPPQWLSRLILHWDIQIQRTVSNYPGLTVSLSPIRYNPSRELKAAISNFDIPGLQRLFREGLAQPTDYIFHRRPISLLEAFATRVGTSNSGALAMYKYLLREGCGNSDPLLAASHAQVLIAFSKHSQPQFRDALDSFLAHGGNVFWQHSNWGTILSLIMRHGASFASLREYLFRQPEPWIANELLPIDRWLVGILEHADAKFRKVLQNYIRQYRSVFQAKVQDLGAVFNVNAIVAEVKNASTRDRVEFLKIISKWGTRDMIAPFVRAGLDLDEKSSNKRTPWLRLSYLSKAVRCGNLETFGTLLDAGACPTQALLYLSRHPNSLPQCKHSASRKQMILKLVRSAEPRHLEEDDERVLALLLRTDDVRRYCSAAADGLIRNFILRHNIIRSKSQELLNSYILVIIFLDLPQVLQSLFCNGFQVNGNNPIGKVLGGQHVSIKGDVVSKYTWLTFAIHLGRTSFVKLFVENGADCVGPDPCGRTAFNMAKGYVSGPHPRATTGLYIWPYQPPQRLVSAEDDQEALAALQLTTNIGYQSDQDSGTCVPTRTDSILSRICTSAAFALQPLKTLAEVIKCNHHTANLWATAVKLSHLTFTEALLLRTGLVASMIALLLYGIIDLVLRVMNLAST